MQLAFEALIKQPVVSDEGWHEIKDHKKAVCGTQMYPLPAAGE